AVCYAEGSESWAANRPLRGQSRGCFRKTCRQAALLRSITRKVPKDTPQIDSPMAWHTEASVRRTANQLICGQSYGSIRKTNRGMPLPRTVTRKLPKERPRN
ncbi:hypothetical protein DD702_08190, partial [Bifidobacterium animalis subsp. lactis]